MGSKGSIAIAIALGLLIWASRHAPPIREVSDGAVIEIYTLEALKGTLVAGPYSRFGWHHPGPVYFYLLAPWYWMSGLQTAGVQAGALVINIASLALVAWTLRRCMTAPLAIGVSLAIAVYVWRAGDLVVSVWNPHVIILPMLAFIVMSACLANTGRSSLLVWLVALGSFLVQTHLATAPIVAVLGVVAVATGRPRSRGAWAAAFVIGVVLWLPSIVEQAAHRPGNMVEILTFFASGGAGQRIADAAAAWSWALTTALTPDFTVANGIELAVVSRPWVLVFAFGEIVALVVVTVRARAGDSSTASLAMMCALASLVALIATTRIRERIVDHEVFWMSAIGMLDAGTILGVIVGYSHANRALLRRIAPAACAVVLLAGVVAGIDGMRGVLNRARTTDDHAVDVLTEAFEQACAASGATRPLVHIDHGVWTIAAGALLQIAKQDVAFAVDDRWTTVFGERYRANGLEDAQWTMSGSPLQPLLLTNR